MIFDPFQSPLHLIGVIANGAVRDVPAARALNFRMFAHNLPVSQAFAHIVDFRQRVEVARMEVLPGDLVHGDRHGVQTIPLAVAAIPAVAQEMTAQKQEIIRLTHSPEFKLEALRAKVNAIAERRKEYTR
jgi:4-hydroxy-4-methyl-2-oxoglutarate aldolase